jgi:hypothetical protein
MHIVFYPHMTLQNTCVLVFSLSSPRPNGRLNVTLIIRHSVTELATAFQDLNHLGVCHGDCE